MEKTFAENLRILRIESRFTQEQMAAILKVRYGTYLGWEYKKTTPNLTRLSQICRFFNITIDNILLKDLSQN